MSERPTAPPRPPARLWGLWAVTEECPAGFWWSHIHGARERRADAPMTFISRDDALAAAAKERAENDALAAETAEVLGCDRERCPSLSVALIGVAPPAEPDPTPGAAPAETFNEMMVRTLRERESAAHAERVRQFRECAERDEARRRAADAQTREVLARPSFTMPIPRDPDIVEESPS
jgi:hypothetical protein